LIWLSHLSLGRMLGFGPKYPMHFRDTHLDARWKEKMLPVWPELLRPAAAPCTIERMELGVSSHV
jgi:Domain of unknown function (DUF4260)